MGKIHELIAVEEDLKGKNKNILLETIAVFNNKPKLFEEKIITFDPTEEGKDAVVEEHAPMTTTVNDRLQYQAGVSSRFFDVLLQKETANTAAKADIIIGETVLAKDVPVTALLGFERELKQIRLAYEKIPTLEPEKVWNNAEEAHGKGVVENIAPTKDRTKKVTEPIVLHPGDNKHPPQVNLVNKDVVIGKLTTTVRSSKFTSAKKHDMLERMDSLITAVKKARMRANLQDVNDVIIGKKMFDYING